jgi:repressor of nif and glnA expression
MPLARDAQVAIAEVVRRMPASAQTRTLRYGLNELYRELETARNDVEAKVILDRELQELRDEVAADANALEINQTLENMLLEDVPELVFEAPQSTAKPATE